MWENFFKHIDIVPANAHILDGNAEDLVKECDAFEKAISDAGGIEMFVGGKSFKKSSLREMNVYNQMKTEYPMIIITGNWQ